MGSLPNPKTLIPYLKTKDCSQGFCTLYCPQWCTTIIFPPPPPLVDDKTDDSDPTFSPLVIAIIGILASAFLLVSYYAIISKYCGRRNTDHPIVTNQNHHDRADQPSSNLEPELLQAGDHGHELWYVSNNGLDEALIKSITVCKYKKGDGLTACTDCSVCLGEFREDEDLRLLPKCTHAFHVHCIDTWLKSHSNCPLCRANIGGSLPVLVPQILYEPSHVEARDHTIVEIREDHQEEEEQITSEERSEMRRSVSMSNYYRCQTRVCEADVSVIGPEAGYRVEECNGSRGLGGVDMKRSFSSGGNQFSKGWKGRNSVIPL